ncbi:TetR/AcrR family transcriptional regulator [Actinacidiphila oryziradicis]|uniref:TetR/AcrR family transcriptional regulator n=1 Tax=Actinacidiphila oryziradicis TaxID=2571141 RepID=UPI0023F364D8|nr:TetR/AcrR family transcriptional regulator [Actinacidiphila oryziradicis]MCW2870382.1 HTH-type transcriptional regulator betI [Actinacidiphila oryziradicis]
MTTHITGKAAARSPRERLLASADELFYSEGVHTVGIDRVIEHAGVAKASLYRLFGSKEELVAAYLGARHERNLAELRTAAGRLSDPHDGILAVFDTQARWLRRRAYRGCAFARASAEPAAGVQVQRATDAYRAAVHELFTELATRADVRDPEMLAAQLHTLFHGADVVVSSSRRSRLIAATRAAAETLIAAA